MWRTSRISFSKSVLIIISAEKILNSSDVCVILFLYSYLLKKKSVLSIINPSETMSILVCDGQ